MKKIFSLLSVFLLMAFPSVAGQSYAQIEPYVFYTGTRTKADVEEYRQDVHAAMNTLLDKFPAVDKLIYYPAYSRLKVSGKLTKEEAIQMFSEFNARNIRLSKVNQFTIRSEDHNAKGVVRYKALRAIDSAITVPQVLVRL